MPRGNRNSSVIDPLQGLRRCECRDSRAQTDGATSGTGPLDIEPPVLGIMLNLASCTGLHAFLRKAKCISEDRRKRGHIAYGFEWAIHTCAAAYLLENRHTLGLSEVFISEECETDESPPGKRHYDLRYTRNGDNNQLIKVTIELKTDENGKFSRLRCDVDKPGYLGETERYYIMVTYLLNPRQRIRLELTRANFLCYSDVCEDIRAFLFRTTS